MKAARSYDEWSKLSMSTAWGRCRRGDWMLRKAAEIGIDRKLIVLAACECARTALRFIKHGEKRPQEAIEVAEAWVRGEATLKQVKDAAYAAYAANASYAASYAAYAANAAYAAANAAANAEEEACALNVCAKIVRKHISANLIAQHDSEWRLGDVA